jgi:hypothetical protein
MSRTGSGRALIFIYAYVIMVALAAAVELVVAIRRDLLLRIAPQGITIKTFGATLFYAWSDVEAFVVTERRSVGFNLSASYRGQRPRATSLSSALTGFDVVLPDNYGWRAEDLAQHLNAVRQRSLGNEASN